MNKKKFTATAVSAAFVLLLLAAAPWNIKMTKANFYMPPAETVWTTVYPQNATYDTNYFELRFRVETNLGLLYFYSLDGQPKKEINTTTLSLVPLPQYSPFIDGTLWNRRTHRGTAELPYLTRGTHELAIYQIYPRSPEHPEDGNVVSQALIVFNVTSEEPQRTQAPAASPTASPSVSTSTASPSSSSTDPPSSMPSEPNETSNPTYLGAEDEGQVFVPEFPLWVALPVFFAAGLASFLFRKKPVGKRSF